MDENEIETQLRESLRHVDAPPGFSERVMARANASRVACVPAPPRPWAAAGKYLRSAGTWWIAAAATLALAVGGGGLQWKHQRDVQRERAAQAQVDLAMQITSHALNQVGEHLGRSRAGQFTQWLQEAPQ